MNERNKRNVSTLRLPECRLKPLSAVKAELLADPEVAFEYDQIRIRRDAAEALSMARHRLGLTQEEVAARAGTTQSAIARLESGRGGVPSLTLLDRVARAVGLQLGLHFKSARAA